jgi:hypothetical protein
MKPKACLLSVIAVLALCLAATAFAGSAPVSSKGQTLYLPLVSHVFLGAKNKPYDLTKTFCFRNRDRKHAVTLISIEYYDGAGQNLGKVLDKPRSINPLASLQMPVASPKKEKNKVGSPCLIVRWKADKSVITPLVQCIMIGATGQQGISFKTTATPIP